MDIQSIPPGFESIVPFTMKKMEDDQVSNYSSSANASKAENIQLETHCDDLKTSTSLKHRSLIKHNHLDSSSRDQIELEQERFSRNLLPKGVIRGCEACDNCQKVFAKWRPEEALRADLEEAPVFYPSEEEFEDTIKYISSIRSKAEMYGICRIVPPASWIPPCPLKEKNIWERSKFMTRIQRIDKLQNRGSMRKIFQVNHDKRKKRKCRRRGVDPGNGIQDIKIPDEAEQFGFEPGPDFTLDEFQKYDDDFKAQYFRKNINSSNLGGSRTILEEQWHPTIQDIEGEYWRMVEKPTEEIEVLYGADLETGVFGSGFPKHSDQAASGSASHLKYINSGWNLNNFPRLPGSVLSFESSDISGVVVPWLYIGMCFSSFCWHVEDHYMYSLNYMHWGAPKMWYGVPGSDAMKLEAAMRKHLPDLFEEQPDLLHKLVTQLSPSILRSEGVPVHRCVQNPGEFVLTFPRAYHAGFNCGFNCAEAVNIAPVDWLPYGQNALDLYREQGRRTSISHDKLLLGAAREAVKENWEHNFLRKYKSNNLRWNEVCGKDGILSKALKTRVNMEREWREFLNKSSHVLKMESSFDDSSERECSVCLFDLHLSAAGCHHCSPDKYACLNHAKQLCSCSWSAKFFLFRYDIMELNVLVEALEGKLSAVYRWARLDMGLALSSHVSTDKRQVPGLMNKVSPTSQESTREEISSPPSVITSEEQKKEVHGCSLSLTKYIGSVGSSQNVEPPIVVLALESVKTSSRYSQKVKSVKSSIPCKRENSLQPPSRNKIQSCQAFQPTGLKIASPEASDKSEKKQSSFSEHKDIILLSDDEENEPPSKKLCVVKGTSQKDTISIQKPMSLDSMTNLDSRIDKPASMTTVTIPSAACFPSSTCIKVDKHAEAESSVGRSNPPSSSCVNISLMDTDSKKDVQRNKETNDYDEANARCSKHQPIDDEKLTGEDAHKKLELDVELRSVDNMLTVSSPSSHQNNLDGYRRQKGPRIAKVIRRINCNVEPLNFGAVCGGKLWCDSNAIYPKGFRSRVRYIDVTDPTNMCSYVSQILDDGLDRPLFMVSVENDPTEVFIHVSASRCWEMVRERINREITKQHKQGGTKLPPLQPPGSVDGMQMFGFSSPAITQVIQAMDQHRVCNEYWQSRSIGNNANLMAAPLSLKRHADVERVLNGLFEKASPEELNALHSVLQNKISDEPSLLSRLLSEEIDKHTR
ncbi:Transcription factor jumonji family protein / zinc finger family protein [Perilla frutescens var. frutescens]|nr:Transcription factor jumonji family protein / zinc finger family protein [Perilla frutescens var. frutescens]